MYLYSSFVFLWIFIHLLSFFDFLVCAPACGCVHNSMKQTEKETPKYLRGNIWAARTLKILDFFWRWKLAILTTLRGFPLGVKMLFFRIQKEHKKYCLFYQRKENIYLRPAAHWRVRGPSYAGSFGFAFWQKWEMLNRITYFCLFFFFWIAGISFWRCIPYTFFFFGLKCFCKTW